MKIKYLLISLFSISLLFFSACEKQKYRCDGKFYIVTTTGMIADAVRNVGGGLVCVEALMGPKVDPHLYKATAADTRRLASANLIVYNGLHLEGKMQDILTKMSKTRSVLKVSEEIPESLLRKPDGGYQGIHDPHIWFDVKLWMFAVKKIRKRLKKIDKKNAAIYEKRAKAYLDALEKLHHWAGVEIAKIPKEKRVLVTSHDAFGYFGAAYGVRVVGLQGVSTAAEAGVKDVERIVALLVKEKIRSIFVETSVPDAKRSSESILQSCKAQGHIVRVGGSLFSDAMGASDKPEGKYLGMIRHNVKTIVNAWRAEEGSLEVAKTKVKAAPRAIKKPMKKVMEKLRKGSK